MRIETARLVLRPLLPRDFAAFAALNADPRVREFFPSVLTREESDAEARAIVAHTAEHGFGLWACERKDTGAFIGFTGIARMRRPPFEGRIEIGWRYATAHWGQGFATEAATAALRDGFERNGLREIVAMTALRNERSAAVMRKLGMTLDHHFEHPRIEEGHPLRPHVLYRLDRATWLAATARPASPG